MRVTFRPLPDWPHAVTNPRRYARFRVDYPATLKLLEYEIDRLDGTDVVFDRAGGLRQALLLHHPDRGGKDRDMVVLAYKATVE